MVKYYAVKKDEEHACRFYSTTLPDSINVRFAKDDDFGCSDFTDKNYSLFSKGFFEDIEIEYLLYERRGERGEEIGPLWLLTFGSDTYEIIGFECTLALILFFKEMRVKPAE